jgi:hypothetical protein
MFKWISAAIGGGVGYLAVFISPIVAIGCVGGGTGFGMAAGPIGAVAGFLIGLFLWSMYDEFATRLKEDN